MTRKVKQPPLSEIRRWVLSRAGWDDPECAPVLEAMLAKTDRIIAERKAAKERAAPPDNTGQKQEGPPPR